jgi:hypothetical protein
MMRAPLLFWVYRYSGGTREASKKVNATASFQRAYYSKGFQSIQKNASSIYEDGFKSKTTGEKNIDKYSVHFIGMGEDF